MLDSAAEITRSKIQVLCDLETTNAFAMQTKAFYESAINVLNSLTVDLKNFSQGDRLTQQLSSEPVSNNPVEVNDEVYQDAREDEILIDIPTSIVNQDMALNLIADLYVRLHNSYNVIIDAIPKRIEYHFVKGFSTQLQQLKHNLGIFGEGSDALCAAFN
jgi:hypothetical protein